MECLAEASRPRGPGGRVWLVLPIRAGGRVWRVLPAGHRLQLSNVLGHRSPVDAQRPGNPPV